MGNQCGPRWGYAPRAIREWGLMEYVTKAARAVPWWETRAVFTGGLGRSP